MAKDYDYEVLSTVQIALFDNYNSNLNEVKMSELMDELLDCCRNHIFDNLTVTYDVSIGRDCSITRDLACLTLQVGGGYGTTGVTIDEDGNLFADGMGDFSTSGIRTYEHVPSGPGDTGVKGTVSFGDVGGIKYVFVCVDTDTWESVALS